MLEQRKGVLVDFEKLQLLVLEGRQYRDDFLIFVYTIQPHASFLATGINITRDTKTTSWKSVSYKGIPRSSKHILNAI